ncbi:hypothetical protein INR49_012937 [Caranx melampygus]|nr:hypothetical protein INR49_012937 [Caranx melampygus]
MSSISIGPWLSWGHQDDVKAKVEVRESVRCSGNEFEAEKQRRGGGWGERGGAGRQRERQLIRLGDDSPMVDIYSIRREGGAGVEERERASDLGGSQDSIITLPTGSGGRRDRDRRDKAPEKTRGSDGGGMNETVHNGKMRG